MYVLIYINTYIFAITDIYTISLRPFHSPIHRIQTFSSIVDDNVWRPLRNFRFCSLSHVTIYQATTIFFFPAFNHINRKMAAWAEINQEDGIANFYFILNFFSSVLISFSFFFVISFAFRMLFYLVFAPFIVNVKWVLLVWLEARYSQRNQEKRSITNISWKKIFENEKH